MENSNYKILTVVSLSVAVIALAIGFAAYSATLNITTSEAVVSGDQFSPYIIFTGAPSCVVTGTDTAVGSAGNLSGTTWSGVSVTMAKPGDSVTCTAKVQNGSLLDAYLESIIAEKPLECEAYGTAPDGNPATNYDAACEGMELTFKAGSYDIATDNTATKGTKTSTMQSGNITNTIIPAKAGDVIQSQEVSFTIEYKDGSSIADGDFKVTIPTMNLTYKTED